MLFNKALRGKCDRIYSVVQNVAAETIYAGYPVVLNVDSPDGITVSKPAAATLSLLLGIAVSDIADDAYGKIMVHGYHTAACVTNATSVAVLAGNILIPVDNAWYLDRSGASDGLTGLVYAAESYATATAPAAGKKGIFIRCL
jgi:hypothetical protein